MQDLFRLCPPQLSGCILLAPPTPPPPPPDASAIFLRNDLLCNDTCSLTACNDTCTGEHNKLGGGEIREALSSKALRLYWQIFMFLISSILTNNVQRKSRGQTQKSSISVGFNIKTRKQ